MDPDRLLDVLHESASAVVASLEGLDDWGEAGTTAGQYRSDLAADRAATEVLDRAGLGWLSEESGRHHPERPVTVVVDPLDGSTNAHRGVPWYATSLCALDGEGPAASVVLDLPRGRRYTAVRGGGAHLDGVPVGPTHRTRLGDAFVALSGHPPRNLGWNQYRALGAIALDLCAVAAGVVDAVVDCGPDAHGPWDYLGGLLVCREAGVFVVDAFERDLLVLGHLDRRTPVAAPTDSLLREAVAARRGLGLPGDPPSEGAPGH